MMSLTDIMHRSDSSGRRSGAGEHHAETYSQADCGTIFLGHPMEVKETPPQTA